MQRLVRNDAFLLVIDVQEKLMPVIDRHASVARNIERLVRACRILDVPAVLTEQYVKGLGPTIPELRRVFEETSGYAPVEKSCFSAYGCAEFTTALRQLQRKHAIVSGVETHVCVYQTVSDLLANGFTVTIAADAISSRTAENRDIGIRRMVAQGAKLSSTEMALFELLVTADTDEFRAVSRLIK